MKPHYSPGTLLLAGLALAPLPALAQAHAPAEDKPGRIVLVPMSVERPAGAGWALVRRTDTELVLVRPADKQRNSGVAMASGRVPDKRARSADELAENIRSDLKKNVDGKRFEVLSEDVRANAAGERKCVSYRQLARDLGAKRADGKAQVIDLHGLACLHPSDEGIVLVATLSERGPEENRNANMAEDAARFFAGIRPHAPSRARTGSRSPKRVTPTPRSGWPAGSCKPARPRKPSRGWSGRRKRGMPRPKHYLDWPT